MKLQTNKNDYSIKTLWIGVLVFALLFSIISMTISIIVYNNQFPRYDRHDETVSASLRYEDIKEQYPRELIQFKSGSNLLQGYEYVQEKQQGLVIVAHGIGGGADSYLPQIRYFLDQGWNVFSYDATGSFDSEGKSTKGFPQALLDLDAALVYITSQEEFNQSPILIFGHSWGGYAAANILHFDHKISGVASISGANSPMEIIIEQGYDMMGGFIYTQYPYLWMYQRLLFGNAVSLNAVDAINRTDTPVLVVHGTEDDLVPFEGSAIISNMDEITNPNARAIIVSNIDQNGHNNLFRSKAGIKYIKGINDLYKLLYDQYEQDIPYEIKQDFYSKIDRVLAQDINLVLMDEINEFFLKSVAN